jgi:predicted acetyltransferase
MTAKTTTATSTVRPLADDELLAFVTIAANAYPAFKLHTPEERQKLAERMGARSGPHDRYYGLFRDGALLGGMRLIDYQMNVRGASVPTGGVGMVAVDLLHKKEKVARDLMRFYLDRCRNAGMSMAVLYPFRPDFYQQMGFGYGTRVSQYAFLPAALPARGGKEHVRMLTKDDAEALAACYARIQARTHGLMVKPASDMERMLAGGETRVVGVERDGRIGGYLAFGFDNDPGGNFIKNNLHIHELVYETPDALAELFAFLRTQADQIHRIVIETQDETFYYLLSDPRDESARMIPSVAHQTNVEAVSLMYRVVDLRALVAGLGDARFGDGTCRVRLAVRDSFVRENDGSFTLSFADGRVRLAEASDADVQLALGISELSSLLMGAVALDRLTEYGLATLSDPGYLETLTRIFAVPRRPICLTAF